MSQGIKRGNEGGAGGGAKKMRGDTVTLRFLLMSKHAGGIIGKGGQTIKRLRSEYNATVSVPDSNCKERVLSIGASIESVISVLRECLPLCHEPPYPVNAGGGQAAKGGDGFEIDFLVHSSQVGGIIGRAGFKIKELRETTNTNIKVYQECLPNSTERVVALGGGEDDIVNALQKILEIMQEQPIKGNIALYDPSMEEWGGKNYDGGYGGPPMGSGGMHGGNRGGGGMMGGGNRGGGSRGGGRGGRGGGGGGNFNGPNSFGDRGGNFGGGGGGQMGGGQNQGGYGGFSGDNFNNFGSGGNQNFGGTGGGGGGGQDNFGGDQTNNTTQVTIPNDLAGAIIGKGGERIRNIRQRSGAEIKIEDPQPTKADRVITISGNSEQIQYAQFLMQQSVRQYSGKTEGARKM